MEGMLKWRLCWRWSRLTYFLQRSQARVTRILLDLPGHPSPELGVLGKANPCWATGDCMLHAEPSQREDMSWR